MKLQRGMVSERGPLSPTFRMKLPWGKTAGKSLRLMHEKPLTPSLERRRTLPAFQPGRLDDNLTLPRTVVEIDYWAPYKKSPHPVLRNEGSVKGFFPFVVAAGKAVLKAFHQDGNRILFQGFQETGILRLGQCLLPSFYLHDLTSRDLLSPDGDVISLQLRLI
jgi:hypothetical protein